MANNIRITDANSVIQTVSTTQAINGVHTPHNIIDSGTVSVASIAAGQSIQLTGSGGNIAAVSVSGAVSVDASVTTGLVVSTKTALTASSPTAASVGVSSGSVVAANTARQGLILTNTSTNVISIAFGVAAVLYSGITLATYGSFTMDEYSFNTGQIFAIASGAGSNLAIQQFTA